MAKKILGIILKFFLKFFIVVLILIVAFMVFLLSNWQCRYKYNHDYITIMEDEYYFDISLILHSEKEFRSVSSGTTYEELVKRFGSENGQLNSNAIKNSIYYALAEDRFVVFRLVPYYSYEKGEKNRNLIVWCMYLCDDKEWLDILFEDNGIYEAAVQTWED